ncbi:unnamed protein product [Arctogadus glacialis]
MTLIFNKESAVPTESRVVQVLKDAVDDLMTFLDVDTTTIAAVTTTVTETTKPSESTEPSIENEGTIALRFTMRRTFTEDYLDPSSTPYQELAANVTTEVNNGFKHSFPGKYSKNTINSFSKGSVIVDMTLIFNKESAVPTESRTVQVLKDAIKDLITFLDVDTTTIVAGPTSVGPTTITSGQATTAGTTSTQGQSTTAGPTSSDATTSGGPTLKMTIRTAVCLPIFFMFIKGLL